jgi:hypothetical protein
MLEDLSQYVQGEINDGVSYVQETYQNLVTTLTPGFLNRYRNKKIHIQEINHIER